MQMRGLSGDVMQPVYGRPSWTAQNLQLHLVGRGRITGDGERLVVGAHAGRDVAAAARRGGRAGHRLHEVVKRGRGAAAGTRACRRCRSVRCRASPHRAYLRCRRSRGLPPLALPPEPGVPPLALPPLALPPSPTLPPALEPPLPVMVLPPLPEPPLPPALEPPLPGSSSGSCGAAADEHARQRVRPTKTIQCCFMVNYFPSTVATRGRCEPGSMAGARSHFSRGATDRGPQAAPFRTRVVSP